MMKRLLPALILALCSLALAQNVGRIGSGVPMRSVIASSLLQVANLSCAGVALSFDVGDVGGGQIGQGYAPIAMKRVGGVRHYFIWAGNGKIYEFIEPSLSPCNSTLSSLTAAPVSQDWGTFTVNNADGFTPGLNSTFGWGLTYDATLDWLIPSWSGSYSVIPRGNSFAGLSFNTGPHTLTTQGCWGLSGVGMPASGTGLLQIPASFLSTYGLTGKRWGVGLGGYVATVSTDESIGLAMYATTPPPTNACAPATTYATSSTQLVGYAANGSGPTCASFDGTLEPSGHNMNCGTTVAPTIPYAMRSSFTQYSIDKYPQDWEPFAGHGWHTTSAYHRADWYDDGVKAGVVLAVEMSRGWLKSAVLASPAPTFVNPNGTFRITSTDTHDGFNLRVGEKIYVPSCVPASDGVNCEITNNKMRSVAFIDSVNTVTGDITYHAISVDAGNGTTGHKPVPGQDVYFGEVYAFGAPDSSRKTLRLQLVDPAQLGEVALGTRAVYDVLPGEEIDLTTLVPGFGSPLYTRHNTTTGTQNGPTPTGVIADPTAQQIILAFEHGKGNAVALYVFNVSHTP